MIKKIKWLFSYERKLKQMMADKQEKIDALKNYLAAPMKVRIKNNY